MKKIFYLLAAIPFFMTTSAHATEFQAGELISIDEAINDDLYLAGETVRIHDEIGGDVMVAAGKLIMDGKIAQDFTVASGEAWIQGEIGDDLRLFSGQTYLDGIVKDDLITASGNLRVGKDSFVGGNLIFGSNQVDLDGRVDGNIVGGTGTLNLNGEVVGNVFLSAGKVSLGPNAKIGGDLNYRASERMEGLEKVVEGKVTYTPSHQQSNGSNENDLSILTGLIAGFSLYQFLSLLLFGLFFIWIYRYTGLQIAGAVYDSPFRTLGIGFLVFILPPLLAIIFLITLIGLPISMALLLLWAALIVFGKVFAAMLIGGKIIRIGIKDGFWRIYGSFAIGSLAYSLIGLIPLAGALINCIFLLMAMGGFILSYGEIFVMLRKKKMV